MDFEDIIKIIAVIGFFVISSLFDSKKKKKKKEEQRRKQEEVVLEDDFGDEAAVSSDSFFDEVKRMWEAEEQKKNSQIQSEPLRFGEEQKGLSSVDDDYFDEKYEEEEEVHFPEKMLRPEEEGTQQIVLPSGIEVERRSKAHAIDLKQAVIHQVILDRKYK